MTEMHDEDRAELGEALASSLARLRHRYGSVSPPAMGPALSAFTGVGLTSDTGDLAVTAASRANESAPRSQGGLAHWRAGLSTRRRRATSALAMVIGTTLGKIALGTAVAAASAGIGHWSGVVDIPGLPDRGVAVAPHVDEDDDDDGSTGTVREDPAVGPSEEGDEATEGADPTSSDKSTDWSKDESGRDFSHDVSTDGRSESTDSSKDESGSDFSHDVSSYERSESPDSSKDE